jgi:hypothetical protein
VKLLDHGLITQKSKDLFARSLSLTKIMNYFCIENHVHWVHGWWTTAGSHNPTWISSGADRRAPRHGSSPDGVENGEWSTGVSFWASPGLGRRCGGRDGDKAAVVALKLQKRVIREGVGVVRTVGVISLL